MPNRALQNLWKTNFTVFTAPELGLIWGISNSAYLKTKINRLVKGGYLTPIRKGLYSLKKEYNEWELANKMRAPSYVSLQTVLAAEGMIFQYYSSLYSVSNANKEIKIGEQKFIYRKIKDAVLLSREGLIFKDNVWRAGKERAFLDMLYLEKMFYFDNLRSLDWNKCLELVKIYNNKRLKKQVESWRKIYVEQD